jgi:hypothetical protein
VVSGVFRFRRFGFDGKVTGISVSVVSVGQSCCRFVSGRVGCWPASAIELAVVQLLFFCIHLYSCSPFGWWLSSKINFT